MLKGGFGLIGAPNLVTSRVDEIFVASGAKLTCSEPNLYVRTRRTAAMSTAAVRARLGTGGGSVAAGAELDLMVSAHMDDFKGAGPQASLNWLRDILTNTFGVMSSRHH